MGDVLDTMAVNTFMPEGPPGLDMIERGFGDKGAP